MQAIRIFLLGWIILYLAACGSSSQTSNKQADLDKVEVWYLLEVGGRPESGQAHYYNLQLPNHCEADSIFFDDKHIAFAKVQESGLWQAYRHFDSGSNVPNGILKAKLMLTCKGEQTQLSLDSIYLKEKVILP